MINNEKVRLMTKLAIYEKNHEEDIELSKYFKSDYIKHNMVKTIICVTFAYIGIIALVIFANIEEWMDKAFELDYTLLGIEIIVSYVVILIVFSLIGYMVYTDRIKNSRENLVKYNANLKKLSKMYDEEKNGNW